VGVILPLFGAFVFSVVVYNGMRRQFRRGGAGVGGGGGSGSGGGSGGSGGRAGRAGRGGGGGLFSGITQAVYGLFSKGRSSFIPQGTGVGVREPFTNPFSNDSEMELDIINTQGATSL
jgi:hypothetical protein